ncbi:MAG: hypothetical protein K2K55_06610, partial [Duncaniella sp.]|nr:hypothetical protein [Duncaniella sp.]
MKSLIRQLYLLITLALSVATPLTVFAFAADHWAPASLRNEGKWVKISVQSTGLHLISSSDLRSWGFNDPAKVRIYGYGGQRISDHLKPEFYVDDLPAVPSAVTSRGVVFYAVGIETPLKTEDGRWTYHSLNPYSTAAYYFLTESDEAAPAITKFGGAPVGTPENSFIESVRHETDLTTPAESGHLLLGEDFRFSTSNTFPFNLTDRVEGTDVWMQCDFFARTLSQPLRLAFKANDAALPSLPADRVRNTSDYGDSCRIRKIFPMQGTRLNLNVSAALSGTVTVASLDNISICYTRALRLPATGYLMFSVNIPDVALGGVSSSDALHVWDVTDPHAVKELNLSPSGDGMGWHNEYYGERAYAAWKEKASLPSPKYAGAVSNQNIHGRNVPSMVIISHPDLINASERVAEIHRQLTDSLDILVVSDVEVYNEFSSGVPDVNAFRKMLKMFYDREPGKLAYVMLMGSVTHDHRFLTAGMSGSRNATLPIWQTDTSKSESTSYSSDDFITFLEDGSGMRQGSDVMNIAVGRLPARNASEAKIWVDRLEKYLNSPQGGDWRNRIVLLADDGDDNIHASQTEEVWANMIENTDNGSRLTYQKIYLDAYEKNAGVTKAAREKFHNLLHDGVIWWNYVGHAAIANLTAEGMMTLQDLSNPYLRRPPRFNGATFSFGHWDGLEM